MIYLKVDTEVKNTYIDSLLESLVPFIFSVFLTRGLRRVFLRTLQDASIITGYSITL